MDRNASLASAAPDARPQAPGDACSGAFTLARSMARPEGLRWQVVSVVCMVVASAARPGRTIGLDVQAGQGQVLLARLLAGPRLTEVVFTYRHTTMWARVDELAKPETCAHNRHKCQKPAPPRCPTLHGSDAAREACNKEAEG